jgi:hypothetical protein
VSPLVCLFVCLFLRLFWFFVRFVFLGLNTIKKDEKKGICFCLVEIDLSDEKKKTKQTTSIGVRKEFGTSYKKKKD